MEIGDNQIYNVQTIVIDKSHDLYKYCEEQTARIKEFENAVIFVCRQILSSKRKGFQNLSDNEKEVIDKYKDINKNLSISYQNLDRYFKKTKNSDYYNSNPMQSTQQTIKTVVSAFKSFFESAKDYKINPDKYLARPKLPKYKKKDKSTIKITNQGARIEDNHLKLPKTKDTLFLGKLQINKLQEVQIVPFYDCFKIILISIKNKENIKLDKNRILGIDLGLNNFLATSNNCGLKPFIVNGKDMKSKNQYFNKERARLQAYVKSSKALNNLSQYRYNFIHDRMHKISAYIIKYCLENNIGTVVVGSSKFWKQGINTGRVNNQNFVSIPFDKFKRMLEYKCQKYGIQYVEVEESYTSKASAIDKDKMPTYNKDDKDKKHKFSGSRTYRGLYKTKKGILINADVNGASNIIRKYNKNAFSRKNLKYLYKTTVQVKP